jgi:CRP-like cAMP-binding protein
MLHGVTSIVSKMESGGIVEVATVGNAGLVELSAVLGASQIPLDAMVQIPGEALRIPLDVLRQEIAAANELKAILDLYTQALFMQIAQAAACNRIHPIEERCARWLLMTHDRVESDEFPLTQEFLSQMLGVRRASVTVAANALQQNGLISYRRGSITVTDRKGLEAAACECYAIITREYERLVGDS